MLLFVGLGNPGTEYKNTRHNIGFAIIDAIASSNNARSLGNKFKAELSECTIAGTKCLLAKPMSYMNVSGVPTQAVASFYKIPVANIIVFHDDLDLAVGKIKIKTGGGDGGHNGLKSLDSHIGKEYKRVRFGIGRPENKDQVTDYVLKKFSKVDMEVVDNMVNAVTNNIELLVSSSGQVFLNKIALDLNPPRNKSERKEAGSGV